MGTNKKNHKLRTGTGHSPRQEEIEKDLYSFQFSLNVAMRYHAKRRRFFENLHTITNAGTVIAGSSAFAALWSNGVDNYMALFLTAIVAGFSSIDLIMEFSKRASLHDELHKKFSRLLEKIIREDLSEKNLKKWKSEKIIIESEAPTTLKLLSILCHNEHAVALGHNDCVYNLGWKIWLKDWWSFDSCNPTLLTKV